MSFCPYDDDRDIEDLSNQFNGEVDDVFFGAACSYCSDLTNHEIRGENIIQCTECGKITTLYEVDEQ